MWFPLVGSTLESLICAKNIAPGQSPLLFLISLQGQHRKMLFLFWEEAEIALPQDELPRGPFPSWLCPPAIAGGVWLRPEVPRTEIKSPHPQYFRAWGVPCPATEWSIVPSFLTVSFSVHSPSGVSALLGTLQLDTSFPVAARLWRCG